MFPTKVPARASFFCQPEDYDCGLLLVTRNILSHKKYLHYLIIVVICDNAQCALKNPFAG